jgi:Rrf2 family transcriptional regulator, iron-sulfur cluster assembly transcription factor
MFKINRKTEYALRGLRYLANKRTDEPVMIRDIAEAVDAAPAFLAKILQLLNLAGLVTSSRGVAGGFRLSRPAENITLREILEATEGPISVNVCVVDEDTCNLTKTCAAHKVWEQLKQMINQEMEGITLKDL